MKNFIIALSIVVAHGCADFDSEEETSRFPKIVTSEIYDVTANSFSVDGVFVEEGRLGIIEKGFIWGLSETNTFDLTKFIVGDGSSDYNATITGLNSNTTYKVRAYVKTVEIIAYGNIVEFKSK